MRRLGQRGTTALPAALAALAVSVALTAAVTDVVRTEVILVASRVTTAAALAAADACLADGVARLPAGWDFGPLLAGPDGVAGTADDGRLDAGPGCTASATAAPGPTTPPRVGLLIEGRARDGRRALDAVAGRATPPGVPALVWLAAPPTGSPRGRIVLDGRDPADPDAPPPAAFAGPVPPDALDAWLGGLPQLATTATAAGRFAPAFSFDLLAGRLTAAGATGLDAFAGSPPGLGFVDGDLAFPGPFAGEGLLYVRGTLDIADAFAFNGVVVASGGVRVRSGASLAVSGALWLGAAPGQDALVVDGELRVRRDAAAVAAVDQRFTLPRPAVLLGLRDLGS